MAEFDKLPPKERFWPLLQALYDGDDTMEELTDDIRRLDGKLERFNIEQVEFRTNCQREMAAKIDATRRVVGEHIQDMSTHAPYPTANGCNGKTRKDKVKEGAVFTTIVGAISTLIYAIAECLKNWGGG